MKKILLFLSVIIFAVTLQAQDILKKPNPPKLVNDAAVVLSPEQKAILEEKLVALDDSTSNQIVVVLIKTLNDYPIEDYAVKLFRDWGIGNKNTNNGILILAAIDDRKIRIEVGYGLEGAMPDITTASIIRNDITPNFKQENYYRGLDEAIESLSKAAVGEYKVKRETTTSSKGKRFPRSLIFFVILFIILGIGRGGGRGGGGIGGGGGGFGGFGGGSSGGGGASGSW
jgi:uncharacterized protein